MRDDGVRSMMKPGYVVLPEGRYCFIGLGGERIPLQLVDLVGPIFKRPYLSEYYELEAQIEI